MCSYVYVEDGLIILPIKFSILRMINDPSVEWSAKLSYKLDGTDKTFPVNSPAEVEKQAS